MWNDNGLSIINSVSDSERRFASLEARVRLLEKCLQADNSSDTDEFKLQNEGEYLGASPLGPDTLGAAADISPRLPLKTPEEARLTLATSVLGLAGCTALVLAAVYLVRLAIDSGWMTPERQVAMAALGGIALIGAGLGFYHLNRRYAALPPGAGIAILFLTVYGAHIYHGLISASSATAGVVVICFVSLWLGHVFSSGMHVLFAVVGAYSTPFLLGFGNRPDLVELLIYFSAWSVLFCVHAVWTGSRSAYLVAMYLAVVGFDLIWRTADQSSWQTAVIYQALQFLIFSATAVIYSVWQRSPMNQGEAYAHLPALLIFYTLEYSTLHEHLPGWAPWIAFASLAFLLSVYSLATLMLRESTAGSRSIVAAYGVLVVFHAGYFELLPDRFAPWVGVVMLPLFMFARRWLGPDAGGRLAQFGMGAVFVVNGLRVLSGIEMAEVPAGEVLRWVYPIVLYIGYWLTRAEAGNVGLRMPLLYAGHLAAMIAVHSSVETSQVFTSVMTSVSWGVIAVAGLVVALQLRDRTLGQSSFLVFAISGMKVLLYDLAGAAPLVRIGSLVALGMSLFVGGWLYQMLSGSEARERVN